MTREESLAYFEREDAKRRQAKLEQRDAQQKQLEAIAKEQKA